MSLAKIQSALITAYRTQFSGRPTAYPNVTFENQSTDSKWAKVDMSPAQPFPFTLGNQGEDMQRGIFQVSFFYPQDTGTFDFFTDYELMRGIFTGGKFFTFSGQSVWVRSCGVTGPVSDGPYLRGIVTVEWEARIVRPAIT